MDQSQNIRQNAAGALAERLPDAVRRGGGHGAHVMHVQSIVLERASSFAEHYEVLRDHLSEKFATLDWTPDLAQDIGSARWMRGLATLLALCALAMSLWPSLYPIQSPIAMPMSAQASEEMRSFMITPLGMGADSGRRMNASTKVIALKSAPERPQVEIVATLARGDSFSRMLQRAGVGNADASRVSALIAGAMPLSDIAAGTKVDLLLGRRANRGEARPLDLLHFRARFDLVLEILRDGEGNLALKRNPIVTDETPLRIKGFVGESLYRSARAAGAPVNAVQEYLKTLGGHVNLDRAVRASDEFDLIVSYRRAATGERQVGRLLYAGINRDGEPKTQLMRWGARGSFFEASGVGEQRAGLMAPVPGRITSRYGMRRHPILGYRRMHAGQDYKASYGTPIVAVTDGRVTSAGRAGGCGIAVKLQHADSLATRYCHMSRKAVRSGQWVKRGQVIGYVGSTGLSTGPHLHYEMYRSGRPVNPASVRYATRTQLSGSELKRFRAALSNLIEVEPGIALQDLVPQTPVIEEPAREIERIEAVNEVS